MNRHDFRRPWIEQQAVELGSRLYACRYSARMQRWRFYELGSGLLVKCLYNRFCRRFCRQLCFGFCWSPYFFRNTARPVRRRPASKLRQVCELARIGRCGTGIFISEGFDSFDVPLVHQISQGKFGILLPEFDVVWVVFALSCVVHDDYTRAVNDFITAE